MTKIPRPTTRVAWLPSAGRGTPLATKHTYVDTRECVVAGAPAWEHIFRCEDTGEERRWGVEARTGYAAGDTNGAGVGPEEN